MTVPSLMTLFSEDTAVWQCLGSAGTGAQSSEKAELTKTHQVSWPGRCAGLLSLSLSTMPLQHVGHKEEVELNHSSALESRSKPSLPPPVSQISPLLVATHQRGTEFSFLNLLPLTLLHQPACCGLPPAVCTHHPGLRGAQLTLQT